MHLSVLQHRAALDRLVRLSTKNHVALAAPDVRTSEYTIYIELLPVLTVVMRTAARRGRPMQGVHVVSPVVPELIAKFYRLFPEVLPRAELDHVAASDGLCRSCYQPWPCDIRRWVAVLRRPASHTGGLPDNLLR